MKYCLFLFLSLIIISCKPVVSNKKEMGPKTAKIDTLINTDKYLALGNNKAELKIILMKDSLRFPNYKIVAKDGDNLIIAKNLDKNTFEIHKKFTPTKSFSDFKVPIFTGKLKDPDFSSNSEAKGFITRIKEGCQNGINFAGHYTLIYWGCGTICQYGVVVDRKTGHIYDGYLSSLGSDFKKDSRLIIFNSGAIDEQTQLIYFYETTLPRTEVWNRSGFEKVE